MTISFHPQVEDLRKKLKTKATAAATSTFVTGDAAESGLKTTSPSTPSEQPVVDRLNQSDIVLSSEDFMLVGRGSVNFEQPAPPGEELRAGDNRQHGCLLLINFGRRGGESPQYPTRSGIQR